MVDFGAAADLGSLDLHKVADLRTVLQVGSGPQPRKRPDRDALADPRAFEMRERMNHRAILDDDAGPEDDMRLDKNILADLRVGREKHGFRSNQRRAVAHRVFAQ